MPPPQRTELGQASAEYVAVLALTALLLAGGTALAVSAGAPGIANGVVGGLRKALCTVTGSSCRAQATEPCVVASRRDHQHLSGTAAFVRLDDDRVVLRERLSDGRARLTLIKDSAVGFEARIGAGGVMRFGGVNVAIGTEVGAALLAMIGDGRVFHARSQAEADHLLKGLEQNESPFAADRLVRVGRRLLGRKDGPRADEIFFEGGLKVDASAEAAVGPASLTLEGVAAAAAGGRVDRRTGETTAFLRVDRGASVLLSALAGGAGELDGAALVGVTFDRRRRPKELSVLAAADARASTEVPWPLTEALPTPSAGRGWELEARADLTDPAIVEAFTAWRRAPADRAAIAALGSALSARARLDTRAYATGRDEQAIGGRLGVAGGRLERSTDRARLVAAATRPPGGLWETRVDCL